MKKSLICLLLALALLSFSFAALAEADLRQRGHYPERGILIGLTEEDEDMGLSCSTVMARTQEVDLLPVFEILYTDGPGIEAVAKKYQGVTVEDLNQDETLYMNMMRDVISCNYSLYQIALFDAGYISGKKSGGGMLTGSLSLDDVTVLTENDGYAYILVDVTRSLALEDAALEERIRAASARAMELIEGITYQVVVLGEKEVAQATGAFPPFETQDLTGSVVTNDIFSGKDLTVVNIWGTFCGPCINEMPELAAWSAEMPENVQIIGLVSDLNSPDDLTNLETALAICEATGANAYTHLIANEDFAGLLSGVVGVPTTMFFDSQGKPVAEPVVGANVPRCRQIVEDYLRTL